MLTENRDSKDIYLYVYEWTHPSSNLVFYTLPMVHIGVKSYYQKVNEYFESLNCVLVEGFSYHHARSITKDVYVGLAKRYGFVTQIQSIVIPEDMVIVPIDMNESEARFSFKALSRLNRIKLRFYRLYLFSSIWVHHADGKLLNVYYQDPAIRLNPLKIRYTEHRILEGVDRFLLKDRDRVFRASLQTFIDNNLNKPFRYDAGIQVGVSHMEAIYDVLNKNGFKWKLDQELLALDY